MTRAFSEDVLGDVDVDIEVAITEGDERGDDILSAADRKGCDHVCRERRSARSPELRWSDDRCDGVTWTFKLNSFVLSETRVPVLMNPNQFMR